MTLVIHGTFARDAKWWRLGSDEDVTFADRLEDELSRHGISGSVWAPALANDFNYSSFAWRGRNRHGDRVKGARRLSSSINELAQRVGATSEEPLLVNFVAHSHGGSVVLEALRRLKSNVRVGRVAMLGTPLTTVRPAFRLARFVSLILLLTLFFIFLVYLFVELGALIFTGAFIKLEQPTDGLQRPVILALLLPIAVFYGWLFWLLSALADVAWRVLCRLREPLCWLQGKSSSLVYGPSPRKLSPILRGNPILLLSCRNDEADLLLQIGSTPTRLYKEYVATNLSKVGQLLEFIFFRPFVLGFHLKAIEMLLERFSLGFPIWRTFLLDYEVAPLDERPYYPPALLAQRRIDVHRSANTQARLSETPHPADRLPPGLRLSLQEVVKEIKLQVRLRHSSYYDNPEVVRQVAEFIAGAQVELPQETSRPLTLKPSGNFWEGLLAANIGVGALFIGITAFSSPDPMKAAQEGLWWAILLGLLLYVIPFAVWGVFYRVLKKRWHIYPWHLFWVVWGLSALILLMRFA